MRHASLIAPRPSTKAFEKLLGGTASALTGYYIGRESALREEWIRLARASDNTHARQMCAQVAREHNHQLVRQMRLIRKVQST